MPSFLKTCIKGCSEYVHKIFGKNSGSMLLATSILGTTASALAQAGVIFFNNKYTTPQKAFMIPQELIECGLSAMSLFFLTKPVQKLTLKTLKNGKFLSTDLVKYLEKNNMLNMRGKSEFNIEKSIEKMIDNIKKSDKYICSTTKEKHILINEHSNALQKYRSFEDSSMAIATTGAAAFSTALVIPVVRNKFAAYYQKKNMQMHEEYTKRLQAYPRSGQFLSNGFSKI